MHNESFLNASTFLKSILSKNIFNNDSTPKSQLSINKRVQLIYISHLKFANIWIGLLALVFVHLTEEICTLVILNVRGVEIIFGLFGHGLCLELSHSTVLYFFIQFLF